MDKETLMIKLIKQQDQYIELLEDKLRESAEMFKKARLKLEEFDSK